MPDGLTPAQIEFINTYIRMPKRMGKKKARKRREAAAREFGAFNVRHDVVEERILQIEDAGIRAGLLADLARAAQIVEANPKKPDFDGGLAHLDQVNTTAWIRLQQQEAGKKYDAVRDRVEAMLASLRDGPDVMAFDNQDDIILVWEFAQEKFNSGLETDSLKDLGGAVKALDRLSGLLDSADTVNPFELRAEVLAEVRESAEEGLAETVQAARRELTEISNAQLQLRDRATRAFGAAAIPDDIEALLDRVDRRLDAAGAVGAAELPARAAVARTAFDAAEAAVEGRADDKTAWQDLERRFLRSWDMITGHAHKDEPTYVKPKFDPIAAAYTTAQDKVARGDFAGASADLQPHLANAATLLDIADDYGRFLVMEASRQAMLDALPAPGGFAGVPQIKTAIEAALTLMDEAKAARDGEDMAEAVRKLDAIPAAVGAYDRLRVALKNFNSNLEAVDAKITDYDAMDAAVTDKVADEIDLMRDTLQEAEDLVVAGDLLGGSHRLKGLRGHFKALDRTIAHITEFNTEYPLFTARRRETRTRRGAGGRVAIEEYYQRLRDDDARIKDYTTGTDKDFGLALAAAIALKDKHAAMMALADQAQDYLQRRGALNTEIARLQGGAAGGEQAAEAIATARQTMANAQAATQSGDWGGAVRLLQHAAMELEQGTRAADIADRIDGMQDTDKLDGIAGDFDAALGEFQKIARAVAGLDTDNVFDDLLDQAAQTAESGRAHLAAAAPDAAAARQCIEQAIAACKQVATKITLKNLFQRKVEQAERDRDIVKDGNVGKSLDPELNEIKARLRAAGRLATDRDHSGALDELTEANRQIGIAVQVRDVYETLYKPARDDFKYVLKKLRKSDVQPGLGDEIARLDRIGTDMEAALTARDTARIRALAKEGNGLLQPYLDLAENYKIATKSYKARYTKTGAKNLNHPALAGQIARLHEIIEGVDRLMAQHAYRAAYLQIERTAYLIDRVVKAIADYPAYAAAKDKADPAIRSLLDRDDAAMGPTHDRIAELKARYDAALKDAGMDQFAGALRKLDGFVGACDAIEDQVDRFERYALAREAGLAALQQIASRDTAPIAPLFARLEGKRDNALAKAAAFDFPMATTLFQELVSDCATAAATLDEQTAFGEVLDAIKAVGSDDTDDLKMSIKAADATFKQLRGRPSAMYVKALLDTVQTALQEARDKVGDDFETARTRVGEAIDHCRGIASEMGQFDQLCDAADLARGLAASLAQHPEYASGRAATETELARVETAMAEARRDRARRGVSTDTVEQAIAALRALRSELDAHAVYVAERNQIRFALNGRLEKHRDRYLMKTDIALIHSALDEAETKATAKDYKGASAELNKARAQIPAAELRLKLAANEVPAPEDIRAFLGDAESTKALDRIIKTLEPDIQRKVIAVAFKERFGCDLTLSNKRWVPDGSGGFEKEITEDTDLDRDAPNLRRFYDLMAALPGSDTLDNDSFLSFSHRGGVQDGSYFNFVEKVVAMHEGEAKTSAIYGISQEAELGPQDDLYKTKEDEPVSFFNWNTLHEVAHAVDDKMGFMTRHLGEDSDTYGGWRHHRADVGPVAAAVAGKFDFDPAYVAEYMIMGEGSSPPVPEPRDCDAEEWDRRRRDCEIWVDRAREGNAPWKTKVSADACTIGNRAYHEAMKGDWVSYLASARAKGVTGYQFRAPAEWFSELYAAFHSGKLKDNHPAVAWLEDL
ncbi:hypothetical protein [Antarcticimicrobium luteum]|uniref:Uncharacterized protein n=1 Tax=Antarcticimicrobium luteum TaxID=2547397 RepID=A0A4R5VFH9_9RHOB|nr:hypothetical protein [Antarcticimicrobium luteum]TDK51051.1 hypothetical protein E1832_04300 [Antarcticimicrobium luteum]